MTSDDLEVKATGILRPIRTLCTELCCVKPALLVFVTSGNILLHKSVLTLPSMKKKTDSLRAV